MRPLQLVFGLVYIDVWDRLCVKQRLWPVLGEMQVLLGSCNCYWEITSSVGKLQLLLGGCKFLWEATSAIGKLRVLLESCKFQWDVEVG
jgi:hypothetical protein